MVVSASTVEHVAERVKPAKAVVLMDGLRDADFIRSLHRRYRWHSFPLHPGKQLGLTLDSVRLSLRLLHRKGEVSPSAETTKGLYESLVKHNLGSSTGFYTFAWEYFERRYPQEVVTFVRRMQDERIPVFLVTTEGSTFAEAAEGYFKFSQVVSNHDLFEGGKLCGIKMEMSTEAEKLHRTELMLNARGLTLIHSAVVVSEDEDLKIANVAQISISTPASGPLVRKATRLHL